MNEERNKERKKSFGHQNKGKRQLPRPTKISRNSKIIHAEKMTKSDNNVIKNI